MNKNLSKAKAAKNDEFYTLLSDIENELAHYKQHLKGKIVYCPCDDPNWSNFYLYFKDNFEVLGLERLIATYYLEGRTSFKREYDGAKETDMLLNGSGDFRSAECQNILEEADIVVTNPPFSLFREFVSLLIQKQKQFLIIGNMNAITYKEIFKLIKQNKLWLGINPVKEFLQPDGTIKKFGNILWFTNLSHFKRNQPVDLYKTYNNQDYPKYDNYDAIEVSKVVNIPEDYYEPIGVPITFLDKYCPEQFEILGAMTTTKVDEYNFGYPYLAGKKVYARIIIKRRKTEEGS